METQKTKRRRWTVSILPLTFSLLALISIMVNQGCQKNDLQTPNTATPTAGQDLKLVDNFTTINLVANNNEYGAPNIDPPLLNAWGLAISDEGDIWVSANGTDIAKIYDGNGQQLEPAVTIPGGAPTGVIYNATNTFIIPSTGEKSEFIYVGESGMVTAWSSGSSAIVVADRSQFDAVYKGVEQARSGNQDYLYATNFKEAKIDVFDGSFNYMSNFSFTDPTLPSGYAPFNIKRIDGQLYVTYAKQLGPDNEDDDAGPGHGYVDIYNPDGSFVKRFASEGVLNSPWGIAKMTTRPGILIGNFGDGKINMFNASGTFVNPLMHNGAPIVIDGLWSIVFPGNFLPASQRNRLYFTAGPDGEEDGLFGYIQ